MKPTLSAIRPHPFKPQPFPPLSSQVYSDIQQFLIHEALLLDHGCFEQWESVLSRDIAYKVCNCSGQEGIGLNAAEYSVTGRESLLHRLGCSQSACSRAQNQLPMTRRFVTNIHASFAHRNNYHVVSYLRVARIEHDGTTDSVWSAERRDLLRATGRSFAIAQRELLIDSIEPGIAESSQFL